MERDEVVEYIERNDSDDEFDEVNLAALLAIVFFMDDGTRFCTCKYGIHK